ncbi:MAG: L-asparaginase [Acidobacteriota bacterium]|jgi:L-asparaginase|nr:L-asparaginase [Acidobacteriota bacterium]
MPAELPRVLVLSTGGTIAAAGYAGHRELRSVDLLSAVPGLGEIAAISTADPVTLGSSDFTPELLWRLARDLDETLAADPGLAGVVVTQGTDSIEETAFFFDLVLATERPVVVTGAMRLPADGGADGPRNLANAVRLAASPATRGLGVLVTLNDEIHAAREVRKDHAIAVDAFTSPAGGPLGYLDSGRIHLVSRPLRRVVIGTTAIEPRVDLVVAVVGSDGRQVKEAVAAGARGLVVELFGRGNSPDPLKEEIAAARRQGVTVVLTSRTGRGRVLVSPAWAELGVVSGEDVDGLKARMVLVVALGKTADPAVLQSYFDRLSGKV